MEMDWTQVDAEKLLEPDLELRDFKRAVQASRPTVSEIDLQKNAEWTAEFGSEGA